VSAVRYARGLLSELRLPVESLARVQAAVRPEAEAWAASGIPWLTGLPEGPPVVPTAELPVAAEGASLAFRALAPQARARGIDGAVLLGVRAALSGLSRQGRRSPGGSCHLLEAADGWLALNLARGSDDQRLLPAWLECSLAPDLAKLGRMLRSRRCAELVERAGLLGLAAARVDPPGAREISWLVRERYGEPAATPSRVPIVMDLSGLWAGPLCGELLARAGARVFKVESRRRPDGARNGPADFFDLLNSNKRNVSLDFTEARGRAQLVRLLDAADLVIESSRPRALQQLGIDAHAWLAARPGRSWLSITGYGRREAMRVAFGDDAAAAAGLSWCLPSGVSAPLFVGDAVADPLGGLHAALAAWGSWLHGGGCLLDLSLCGVVQRVITRCAGGGERLHRRRSGWSLSAPDGSHAWIQAPRSGESAVSTSGMSARTKEGPGACVRVDRGC